MQRFTELKVWQRSHALALDVYRTSAGFPADERFGLTQQLRRAAVSIVANIAEGSKRQTGADYARLLNIAEGSVAEAEALLRLARDLLFAGAFEPLIDECEQISRMINTLRDRIANP